MCKPSCNGGKMCIEENGVYLKTATYTLAYIIVCYSLSYVISDPFMMSCGWCKTIITHYHNLASSQIYRNQIWWKHDDYDPCLETLTLSSFAELTAHVWWIKFVTEILLISNFIIKFQSILNVCNNTNFKTRVKLLLPLSMYWLFINIKSVSMMLLPSPMPSCQTTDITVSKKIDWSKHERSLSDFETLTTCVRKEETLYYRISHFPI